MLGFFKWIMWLVFVMLFLMTFLQGLNYSSGVISWILMISGITGFIMTETIYNKEDL